jgi:hypothetical protein
MKITKTQLKQIIMEEIANEGVLDIKGDPLQGEPDEETIVTGPDGKWDTESRDLARLEDAIRFLLANGREELAEPLRDIQRDLENMGYASSFKDDPDAEDQF